MNRKEYKLLVEGWQSCLSESPLAYAYYKYKPKIIDYIKDLDESLIEIVM
jgi:hypothetical protein